MSFKTSQKGIDLIKSFEGCRLTSYQDSVGMWTIGYGHSSGIYSGMMVTEAQAEAYLKSDLVTSENAVNKYVTYATNQNQFDALVSCTFKYVIQSNAFLSDEKYLNQSDSFEIWIRIVRKLILIEAGTTESGYKDIIIYRQNDNAYLAVQSSENLTMWTLWELPQYGVWLEKKVAIFMRVATGL